MHGGKTNIVTKPVTVKLHLNTLSKCPGGHPILHKGLKLNSKISAGKYSPGQVGFLQGS